MKAGIALLMVLIALPSTTRGASSENLKTTCQDSTVMEGKGGQIQYFLRPGLNLEPDSYVLLFIRKHGTPGDILRCEQNAQQSEMACYAFDHRFRLGELARHQLTMTIANTTMDLQGRYELHIVANGVFEPATSCNLTVQSKGGAEPENNNTKVIAVGIGIGICFAIIVISISIIVLLKHGYRKRVTGDRKKVGAETSTEIPKAGGHAKTVCFSKEQADKGGIIGNTVVNTLGETSTENKAYQHNSIPHGVEQENVDSTEADALLEGGQQLTTTATGNSVTEGAEHMLNERRPLLWDQQHDQADAKQSLGSPIGTEKEIKDGVEIAEPAEELDTAVSRTESTSESSKHRGMGRYKGNGSKRPKNAPRGPLAELKSKQETTCSDKQSGHAVTGHTLQGIQETNTSRPSVSGTSTEARELSPSVAYVSTGRPKETITAV